MHLMIRLISKNDVSDMSQQRTGRTLCNITIWIYKLNVMIRLNESECIVGLGTDEICADVSVQS